METNTQYIANTEKLEFRQIVLEHLKKILDISTHELRDCTRRIQMGAYTQTLENEDTRYSFIQAVDTLAIILYPYFDKQMHEAYKEFDEIYNIHVSKLTEKNKNDLTKKKIISERLQQYGLYKKLKLAREVFRELNLLLHRNDYLKDSIYGEGNNDDNEINEDK